MPAPHPVRQHRPRDHPRPARGRRAARPSTSAPPGGPVLIEAAGPVGDTVLDRKHHGGRDQAVYAYAVEDLRDWSARLARALPPGTFGENLTTEGVDVTGAVIGEVLGGRVGRRRRPGAAPGDLAAHPVRDVPGVDGRAALGASGSPSTAHRGRTCGCWARVRWRREHPLRGRRAAGARGHGRRGVPAAVRRPGPPAAAARPGRGPAPAARRPARRPGPPQRLSRAWPDTGLPDRHTE